MIFTRVGVQILLHTYRITLFFAAVLWFAVTQCLCFCWCLTELAYVSVPSWTWSLWDGDSSGALMLAWSLHVPHHLNNESICLLRRAVSLAPFHFLLIHTSCRLTCTAHLSLCAITLLGSLGTELRLSWPEACVRPWSDPSCVITSRPAGELHIKHVHHLYLKPCWKCFMGIDGSDGNIRWVPVEIISHSTWNPEQQISDSRQKQSIMNTQHV